MVSRIRGLVVSIVAITAAPACRHGFDPLVDGGVGSGDAGMDACAATYCSPVGQGFCSEGGWCWENPIPTGNHFVDISGTSPSDVWALAGNTLLHFDGTNWTERTLPDTGVLMTAIYVAAPSDIWIAGAAGTLLHGDGTTFAIVPTTTTEYLLGVCGTGPNDVWVVGLNSVVRHWDGTTLTPDDMQGNRILIDCYAASATEVFISAEAGLAFQKNGATWSSTMTPISRSLVSIGGASATDVWAISNSELVHFDGLSWTAIPVDTLTYEQLTDVYVAASNDVWAVGSASAILHYDGSSWSSSSSEEVASLTGVWGAAGTVYSVGRAGIVLRYASQTGTWSNALTTRPVISSPLAVSGTAPNDIWGVGNTVDHWDGTKWSRIDTGFKMVLQDVWARASDDVWACGAEGVLHYNGTSWAAMPPVGRVTSTFVPSDGRPWISLAGKMLRWEGTQWQEYNAGGAGSVAARDLWGSSATDVWAASQNGRTIHWDGVAWNTSDTTLRYLSALWGIGANDVWVGATDGALAHWNGTTWTAIASPTTRAIQKLWGGASNDVWAVSDGQLAHWDGTAWSSNVAPTSPAIQTIVGTAQNDAWGFGTGGFKMHWDGATWTIVDEGTPRNFAALTGTAANDVWALGDVPFHRNGVAWVTIPKGLGVSAAWAAAPDDVWAVGSSNFVHWDGVAWQKVSGPLGVFEGAWGIATNDIWAVGRNGVAAHFDGTSWSVVDTGTTEHFTAVWGAAANDVWAVSRSGTILHWDGTSWSQVGSPVTTSLFAISGTGPQDIWAVGVAGVILHWDGSAWTSVPSSTTVELDSIVAISPNLAWAGGWMGTILRWSGSDWSRSISGTDQIVRELWAAPTGEVFAIVDGPGILVHAP